MQKDDFDVRYFPDLSSFQAEPEDRGLRVCIATEEIVGPVRNGGIASTYYHLARMLAADDHQVTVLYLKGNRCENETINHWIDWYARHDIKFVPLPFESIPQHGFAPFWQRRYYAFYRWLSEQKPFDVVHTSEWRGGAFYVLGAKRIGLKFQDTLFLVKSSSPHIWNRHYQMRTIENNSMLACSHAEQKTIEWADIVIGGSAHLLSFMERVGYQLPEGRIYVQPNVIDFQDLKIKENRPDYQYGQKVKSGELVFFGRLEARKGLEIFCDALDQLAGEGVVPDKVYFLGKQGQNMPSHPNLENIDYIRMKADRWPFDVEILSDRDQREAIEFLCAKPRIAVMPSLIENSTMTVYEALVHKIPFLATRVGGTPELIDSAFHDATLTEPHPVKLAQDLRRIMQEGGTVAKASFAYKDNMATWRGFHAWLAHKLTDSSVEEVIAELSYDSTKLINNPRPQRSIVPPAKAEIKGKTSLTAVVYHCDDPSGLRLTLRSLTDQNEDGFDDILVVTDGPVSPDSLDGYESLKDDMPMVVFMDLPHQCIGSSYNAVIKDISEGAIVFLRAGRHIAKENMASILRTVFSHQHVRVVTAVYDCVEEKTNKESAHVYRFLPMGGDMAAHLIHDGSIGGSCFAARKELLLNNGGFFPGYHIPHVETEMLARCVTQGEELWVIPEVMHESYRTLKSNFNNKESGNYLRIRPVLQSSPYSMKRLMLRLGEIYGDTSSSHIGSQQSQKTTELSYNIIQHSNSNELANIRLGLIFDPWYGTFGCVAMKNQVSLDDCKVFVKAQGMIVKDLNFEPLGDNYLIAKWPFNLQPYKKSITLITFSCETPEKKFVRSVSAIWGIRNTVHITSKKFVAVGELNEINATQSLPNIVVYRSNIAKNKFFGSVRNKIKKFFR